MSDMNRLEQGLKMLRESDADRRAPDWVETRLRTAFRERHRTRRLVRWWWAGAVAASLTVGVAAWTFSAPMRLAVPDPPILAKAPDVPAFAVERSKPHAPARIRSGALASRPQPRPVEQASSRPSRLQFIPLPFAPPLLPEDQGQVIRVRLPRQSIRRLGFPVNEDRLLERIPADILMGEDGLARGIRFVRASEIQ